MGLVLLLLFIAVPILEIAVFIQVGDWIGLWPTLGLILLTAVLGSWQVRLQGLATLARARAQLDRGEIPAKELFDGVCLLAAGALLLTPGFVTDLMGASLFLPPVRAWLRRVVGHRVEARVAAARPGAAARTRVFVDGEEVRPEGPDAAADPRSRWGRPRSGAPGTIEGEWTEVQDQDPEPPASEDGRLAGPRPPDDEDAGTRPGTGEGSEPRR